MNLNNKLLINLKNPKDEIMAKIKPRKNDHTIASLRLIPIKAPNNAAGLPVGIVGSDIGLNLNNKPDINKKISEPNKKLHAAYSKSPILGAFVK